MLNYQSMVHMCFLFLFTVLFIIAIEDVVVNSYL
jgi:hypothetical protein